MDQPKTTIDGLFNFVEHFLSGQIRENIRLHGFEESGAGNYYARRSIRGALFPKAERDLFHSIMQLTAHQPVHIVHAGNGLGTFSILLTLTGASVLGIDMGRERAWGARQLRGALFEPFPEIVTRYEFREGEFPKVLRPDDRKPNCKNVLLFTNVGSGWPDELEQQIIGAFASFDLVYFSSSMFGRRGATKEGSEEVLAMVKSQVPGRLEKLNDTPIFTGFYYTLEVDHSHKAKAADPAT